VIVGVVGLPGGGKTYYAFELGTAWAKARGALLASNARLTGAVTVREWAERPWEPGQPPGTVVVGAGRYGIDTAELETIMAVCKVRGHGVVLILDEIGIIMSSRFWQRFPVRLMWWFAQSRKLRSDVIWTSQDEDVDAFIRRRTAYVWKVRAVPESTVEREERGVRPWFFFRSKWRSGAVGKRDRRLGWQVARYRRSVEQGYDTDELIAASLSHERGADPYS